jgi:hypothetical protein
MSAAVVALTISLASLLIAATSLGWNIYRDIILKPKLRVAVRVAKIIQRTQDGNLDRVIVTVTNFGPGKTRAEMLILRPTFWKRLLRQSPR